MSCPDKLTLRNVTKRLGQARVLDSIDLSVEQGETICILGPSGSGKTTLLNLIVGLMQPDQGEIRLDGREISQESIRARGVGIVFQEYSLFPFMTVAQNVAFPLRAASNRKRRFFPVKANDEAHILARTKELLALVNLDSHLHKKPRDLSGGEQQRVAIARALALSSNLLCLDEPLAALDANLRRELQDLIIDLQRSLGQTMIYVTHDQAEALRIADRIVILEKGKIRQVGAPEQVYWHPEDSFVARFVGSCNLLPVHGLEHEGGDTCARTSGGTEVRLRRVSSEPQWPLLLGLRPETMKIVPDVGTSNGDSFHGYVQRIDFLGGVTEVCVTLDSGENLTVAQVEDGFCIEKDMPVRITLRPDRAFLVTDTTAQDQGDIAQ